MAEEKDNRLAILYEFKSSSEWNDLYEGIVVLNDDEIDGQLVINIHDKADIDKIVHTIKINKETVYHKCKNIYIQWKNDNEPEYALSFLTEEHRDFIFSQLKDVYGMKVEVDGESSPVKEKPKIVKEPVTFHPINSEWFPQICTELGYWDYPFLYTYIDKFVEPNHDYLRELLAYACQLIDFDDLSDVHELARGFDRILMLGQREFIEVLLSDEFYLQVFRIMNYHTDLFLTREGDYDEQMASHVRYHHVIDFKDQELEKLIHLTFRLQYLRDIIVDKTIFFNNDALYTIINENYAIITRKICNNQAVLKDILSLLNPEEDVHDVVSLLHNLFSLQGNGAVVLEVLLYNVKSCFSDEYDFDENKLTLLNQLEKVLSARKQSPKTLSVIFFLMEKLCNLDSDYCCSFILHSSYLPGKSLMNELIQQFLYSNDYGHQLSIFNIITNILGKGSGFSLLFQDHYHTFYTLYLPIITNALIHENQQLSNNTILLIIELISVLMPMHKAQMKLFLSDGKFLYSLASLMKTQSLLLKCDYLQLFSTGLNALDSWFAKLLVDKGIVQMILDLTTWETIQKYNMYSSRLLNFFSIALINKEVTIMKMVMEAVETSELANVMPFTMIREWLSENEESEKLNVNSNPVESERDQQIREKLEEEAYFSNMDEEEENTIIYFDKVEEKEIEKEKKKEEEEEKEAEKDLTSVESIFSRKKQPIKPMMRMNLKIDFNMDQEDVNAKKTKTDSDSESSNEN